MSILFVLMVCYGVNLFVIIVVICIGLDVNFDFKKCYFGFVVVMLWYIMFGLFSVVLVSVI